jgi:predicted MPP superfamily phosphohydrolase
VIVTEARQDNPEAGHRAAVPAGFSLPWRPLRRPRRTTGRERRWLDPEGDEGLFVHGSTMLAVTRGLGAVGLPWRMGANPEAVLLRIRAVASD